MRATFLRDFPAGKLGNFLNWKSFLGNPKVLTADARREDFIP